MEKPDCLMFFSGMLWRDGRESLHESVARVDRIRKRHAIHRKDRCVHSADRIIPLKASQMRRSVPDKSRTAGLWGRSVVGGRSIRRRKMRKAQRRTAGFPVRFEILGSPA